MKINKILTSLIAITPVIAIIPTTTSCNKLSAEQKSAQEYISNRTFGIAGIDSTGDWTVCGTAWILSDATPAVLDDFQYYVATNWHVNYGIEQSSPAAYGYHFDGQREGTYTKFSASNFEWVSDPNKYCFETGNTKKGIDFHVAKVNFGSESAIPSAGLNKLKAVNVYYKEHGYINKFIQTTTTKNYCSNTLYCGGYPVPTGKNNQVWKFETINPGKTEYVAKETKYFGEDLPAGHAIDNKTISQSKIIDISPQYLHTEVFDCVYDASTEQYVPKNWSLLGGASGSMLITKINDEFVVVGIYWGGFELVTLEEGDVYFCPAWSIFKSEKNFVEDYE